MTEFVCGYCDSDCYSASELLACEQRCADEDLNTRGWYSRYNPHRKD